MTTISDEFMRDMLVKTKPYTLVLLRATPKHDEPGMDAVVWEHGRRNFSLRADGTLAIVCPVRDGSEWSVDSWTRAYGQSPDIMTIAEWRNRD